MYPIIHGCSVDVAKILSGVLLDLSLDGDVRHHIIEHHDIGKPVVLHEII